MYLCKVVVVVVVVIVVVVIRFVLFIVRTIPIKFQGDQISTYTRRNKEEAIKKK